VKGRARGEKEREGGRDGARQRKKLILTKRIYKVKLSLNILE